MKKGFTITFDKTNKKQPWRLKYIGNLQQISYFDFGTGKKGILRCVKCGVIHWKDLEDKKKRK